MKVQTLDPQTKHWLFVSITDIDTGKYSFLDRVFKNIRLLAGRERIAIASFKASNAITECHCKRKFYNP